MSSKTMWESTGADEDAPSESSYLDALADDGTLAAVDALYDAVEAGDIPATRSVHDVLFEARKACRKE